MEPQSLNLDSARCTACMACELACSFTQEGFFSPAYSRIKVLPVYELGVNVPIVCVNCAEAPCLPSCPSEAIVRGDASGVVSIVAELCSGCGECVEACPYGAVHIPAGSGLALMCDLCGGEPACVGSCLYGALDFERKPDRTYASLEAGALGLPLSEKRWHIANAVAERVGQAWEARP